MFFYSKLSSSKISYVSDLDVRFCAALKTILDKNVSPQLVTGPNLSAGPPRVRGPTRSSIPSIARTGPESLVDMMEFNNLT